MAMIFSSGSTPAFFNSSIILSNCADVSAVEPDFEMTSTVVRFISSFDTIRSTPSGSMLSSTVSRPAEVTRASTRARVPSTDPPIPSNKIESSAGTVVATTSVLDNR